MAIVQSLKLEKLIIFFVFYLLIHILIGILKNTYKKDADSDAYKILTVLFKWWPAAYTLLLLLALYGTR